MTKLRQKIIEKAMDILENSPNGIRYSDLIRSISKALPDVNENTIHGTIWNFKQKIDKGKIKDVVIPEKGLYILRKYFKENEIEEIDKKKQIKEEEFYKSFVEYLVNDLEECTKAIPLGGNRFQDRWGTPDVIGTYRILGIGHIQPPIEVISAKIETDTNQIITAFGQACSYKLFSHKVYLAIPKNSRGLGIKDIKKLESLCLKFGIGLILFDRNNKEKPEFQVLTRAAKSEPDYFYLHRYLRLIEDIVSELF